MTRALIVIAIWFASGVLTESGPAQAQQPAQMPPDAPQGVLPPLEGGQGAPPAIPPPPSSDVPSHDFCRQLRATFDDYPQDRQKAFAPYLKRCDEAGR